MTANAEFWDDIAASYAARPVDDPAAFARKIAVTRDLLTPDSTLLNVGCGTGSLCMALADTGATLHGIDIAPEMLRFARDKARDSPRVTFHQGQLADAPFAAGSLDVLCAYSLLHLLDDRADFLRRAFELLRPGGAFVSSTVCLSDSWVPYRPLLAVLRWVGKAPWVDLLSADDLEAELRAAGFVDLAAPDVGAADTIAFRVARKPDDPGPRG